MLWDPANVATSAGQIADRFANPRRNSRVIPLGGGTEPYYRAPTEVYLSTLAGART